MSWAPMASDTAENAVLVAAPAGSSTAGINRLPNGMPTARPTASMTTIVVVLLMPLLRASGLYRTVKWVVSGLRSAVCGGNTFGRTADRRPETGDIFYSFVAGLAVLMNFVNSASGTGRP